MTVFYNAKWWIEGSFENLIKAVSCVDGKVVALHKDIPSGCDAKFIDLKGAYAFPGFTDTHTHSFEGGLYSLMIDLSDLRSVSEVLEKIREESVGLGQHIFGWNLDETLLKEKRFPTTEELDTIIKDKNLVIRRIDGHSCLINSFAKQNILNSGIKIESDGGVYRGFSNDYIVHWFHKSLSEETIIKAYHAASEIALKGGFSSIHTMIGDADYSITHYSLLKEHLSNFKVRFIPYPQSFNLKAALDAGAERIGGCILADGSIGSKTAALFKPYLGTQEMGKLYQTDEFWYQFISEAHKHNLQVGVHCIGDRAISQINDVYLKLNREEPKDLRHQLIHCELTDDALVGKIKESAAVPVMQPAFDHLWGGKSGFYSGLLGPERAAMMNRFGSMLERGITITGSSDWYITQLNIGYSLAAAMNHTNPIESLSLKQAVDIYTKNAAWLSFEEDSRGQIKEGCVADFTLLDNIPSTKDRLSACRAIIRDGELSYEAD